MPFTSYQFQLGDWYLTLQQESTLVIWIWSNADVCRCWKYKPSSKWLQTSQFHRWKKTILTCLCLCHETNWKAITHNLIALLIHALKCHGPVSRQLLTVLGIPKNLGDSETWSTCVRAHFAKDTFGKKEPTNEFKHASAKRCLVTLTWSESYAAHQMPLGETLAACNRKLGGTLPWCFSAIFWPSKLLRSGGIAARLESGYRCDTQTATEVSWRKKSSQISCKRLRPSSFLTNNGFHEYQQTS